MADIVSEAQPQANDDRIQKPESYIVELHEVVRDLQAMARNLLALAQVMIDRLEKAHWRDMPRRPSGLHLLDTEPERETPAKGSHFREGAD